MPEPGGQRQEVIEFAKWLAESGGPDDRAELLKQVSALAKLAAPEENLEQEPPVRSLVHYLQDPPPSPPGLVSPHFLVEGGVTVTVARAGKGKTSLALNRILPWAAGRPLFDELPDAYVPARPLRTLIIENEGAGGMFYAKIRAMLENHGGRFSDEEIAYMWENVLVWGEGGYAGMKVDDPGHEDLIRRGIEKHQPDVVLMEPFARLHSGEENSNTDINNALSILEAIATDYEIGILLAHHEGKSRGTVEEIMDRSRGATALEGVVVYMEFFVASQGGRQRELIAAKKRYGQEPWPPPISVEWREDWSGWYDYIEPSEQVARAVQLLSYDLPKFTSEIAEEMEEKDRRKVKRWLEQAKAEGRVQEHPGFATGAGSSGSGWTLKRAEDGAGDVPVF